MTRTDVLKGVYFARLAALVLLGVGAVAATRSGVALVAVAAGTLFGAVLLSGRLQAHFWAELLAGLHDLNQHRYANSKSHSERFLSQLRERPWQRHLIWLGTSSYSLNAEVLALNNLGAAEVALGEFDDARAHLTEAMALDPKCPLPFHNMGKLVLCTASTAEALPWFERAAALGFRGGLSDQAVMASQRRNAELSVTGAVTGVQPAPPAQPPLTGLYIVHLLNDEQTPFEVAVAALEKVFGMTGAEAIRTAKVADQFGRAACAGFDQQELAQAKAEELATFARIHGHSLTCTVEQRVLTGSGLR